MHAMIEAAVRQSTEGTRRSMRKPSNRQLILAAARDLLRGRSFDSLSMEQVAAKVGLTRRAVYNHFASKEELYRVSREDLIAQTSSLIPNEIPLGSPLVAALREYAHALVAALASQCNEELLGSIIRDADIHDWLPTSYHRHVIQPVQRALEVYFYAKRQEGAFDCDDIAGAALLFIHMMQVATPSRRLGALTACLPLPAQSQQVDALVRSFLIQYGADTFNPSATASE